MLGKSQRAVRAALVELRAALPFPLRGLDSDNGSEFINTYGVDPVPWTLYRWGQ